jgi:PAS domain S-box-containing protein
MIHSIAPTARPSGASLSESASRYRTLFDLSPVAVYAIDTTGVITEFNDNAAELWGRRPNLGDTDEVFCGSLRLYRPDGSHMPHNMTPMAMVVDGDLPECRDTEVVIERPDGSRVHVIVNIVPLRDADGVITGAINCFYDITEISRMAQKLRDSSADLVDLHQRKDEFIAMLSHELRNPLAPIAMAAQLLGQQPNQTPVQRKATAIIDRQIGKLTHLIGDLMEMSRITSGKIHLKRSRIAMNSVVTSAVETAIGLIDERHHKLVIAMPTNAIWMHVDSTRIEQVIVNLLTNAAKYMSQGGNIWLTCSLEGNTFVLSVKDSGIGIDDTLLPHVFELFSQATSSLDRSEGGLGIGLSLVQKLVQLHGGTISVTSELGVGSEFIMQLPADAVTHATSLPVVALPAHAIGAVRRIMIVEDNVDMANILEILLQMHDVKVLHDGAQVLDEALRFRPDLMLMDIGLPGLDGYAVARQIRSAPSLKNTILVSMTGYGQEADRNLSQEAGFNHHLLKPAKLLDIEKIIASLV